MASAGAGDSSPTSPKSGEGFEVVGAISDSAPYPRGSAISDAETGSFAVADQSSTTLEDRQQRDQTKATSRYRASSAIFMETLNSDMTDLTNLASSEADETEQEAQQAPEPTGDPRRPTAKPKKADRIYYLDWLRILAIYLVVMYHCIQALDWIDLWQGIERQHVVAYKASSLQVGMPIFFHISGRAQALTGKPKAMRATCIVRFKRLIIPFVVGYFLLIPFWQYVWLRERPDNPQYFIVWIFWFFNPFGSNYKFSVGWLWFLPTLFGIGVCSAPIFLFAENHEPKYGIISVVVLVGMSGLLILAGCPWMMMVMFCMGPLGMAALTMIVPFPPKNEVSWSEMRWLAVQGSTVMQILTDIGLVCSFKYSELGGLKMMPAMLLFFCFYVHGYFVQRWAVGRAEAESSIATQAQLGGRRRVGFLGQLKVWTGVWQILTVGMMLLSIATGTPVGEWEEELFPIYSASYKGSPFFGAAHICGTWAMIGLTVAWFQAFANREIHPEVYKHATSSVIVIYIFHFVFIAPFVYWVCRDFGMTLGGWKLINPVLTMAVGCIGPLIVYVLLMRYPAAGALFGL